jgi:predicted DNA-binding transcriptional regulator AlpA
VSDAALTALPDQSSPHIPTTLAATYTKREVAALLQLNVRSVERLDAAGKIPGRLNLPRAVRFLRSAVDAWLAEGCPVPARTRRVR